MGRIADRPEQTTLKAQAFRGRSDLYRYIWEHFDKLKADGVDTEDGPSWDAVAVHLSCKGQTNRDSGQLTGEVVRKVFKRVARKIALQAKKAAVSESPRVRAPATWKPEIVVRGSQARLPPQPPMVGSATAESGQRSEGKVSLLTKPKTPEQLIAEVALKKPARDRTPEEKIAVLIAGQQDRSYSG